MKTVAAFLENWKAHLAKNLLDEAEIPSILLDENTSQLHFGHAVVIGGIKLQVPDDFYEQAIELLREAEVAEVIPEPEPQPKPEICPRCRSSRISPIQGIFGKRWECRDCGERWK